MKKISITITTNKSLSEEEIKEMALEIFSVLSSSVKDAYIEVSVENSKSAFVSGRSK